MRFEKMCKTLLINDRYIKAPTKNRLFFIGDYHVSNQTDDADALSIDKILPPEIDIFSELPCFVFENEHASVFLREMKRSLLEKSQGKLRGIALPKLLVSDHTENSIVLEWIFNYFRLYFSFDPEDGDYYGEVVNNSESEEFRSFSKRMVFEKFPEIAEAEIDSAITLLEGGKR